VNEVLVVSVPSTVATVVRCCMMRLAPAMSSMFMVVHLPVVSAPQPTVQSPPSLKIVPGVGAFGEGMANAVMTGKEATRIALNMMVCDAGDASELGRKSKEKVQRRVIANEKEGTWASKEWQMVDERERDSECWREKDVGRRIVTRLRVMQGR